tara:strand:+ start:226 stop:450 length:225 start_codon:yes stop_codon:yes gene_type:complete
MNRLQMNLEIRTCVATVIVGFCLLAGCTRQGAQETLKSTLNSFEWGKPEIIVNPNAEEEALTKYLCDQYGNCNP